TMTPSWQPSACRGEINRLLQRGQRTSGLAGRTLISPEPPRRAVLASPFQTSRCGMSVAQARRGPPEVGEAVASREAWTGKTDFSAPESRSAFLRALVGRRGELRCCPAIPVDTRVCRQQKMPVEHCLGDVHELLPAVARVVAQHRERLALVDLVALHQDPL